MEVAPIDRFARPEQSPALLPLVQSGNLGPPVGSHLQREAGNMRTDKYGREGADIIGRFAASYKQGRGSLVCNGEKGGTVHSAHILVVFLR